MRKEEIEKRKKRRWNIVLPPLIFSASPFPEPKFSIFNTYKLLGLFVVVKVEGFWGVSDPLGSSSFISTWQSQGCWSLIQGWWWRRPKSWRGSFRGWWSLLCMMRIAALRPLIRPKRLSVFSRSWSSETGLHCLWSFTTRVSLLLALMNSSALFPRNWWEILSLWLLVRLVSQFSSV